MMQKQAILASCLAALSMLQLAVPAAAAAADTLSAGVLRTGDDAAGADIGTVVDVARRRADVDKDDELEGASPPVPDHMKFFIKLEGVVPTWPKVTDEMFLTADETEPADHRDSVSNYVYADRVKHDHSAFVAEYDASQRMYIFQHIDRDTGKPRYLAVHNYYKQDELPEPEEGYRLIATDDRHKATMWTLLGWRENTYLITVGVNRDSTGEGTEYMLLGMSHTYRSDTSQYIGVFHDTSMAAVVAFETL